MRRPFLSWLLCVLVVVGSTNGSVTHDHAQGGRPHAHGVGLLSAAANPPGATTADPHADGRHRHVVLLGLELYEAGQPTDGGDPDPTGDRLGLGECVAGGASALPSDATAPAAALWAAHLLTPSHAHHVAGGRTAARLAAHRDHPRPVCDAARRERSGVLTA